MDNQNLTRWRSASTLANNITFTHTRGQGSQTIDDDESEDESPKSPMMTQQTRSNNASAMFYTNKNGSSSTLHSITHTLSNVGFTSVLPNSANTNGSDIPLSSSLTAQNTLVNSASNVQSPTVVKNKVETALSRAKLFAKTKTKELQKKTKSDFEKSYHHQHQNFLKKTGHSGLSSSSSTSQVLDSANTLYSFDPVIQVSENDTLLRTVSNEAYIKNLNYEERDQLADEIWRNITSCISPIFKMDKSRESFLKTPIEDLNKFVSVYLRIRIENGTAGSNIIGEIQEFLREGLGILENQLNLAEDPNRGVLYQVLIIWKFFIDKIYFYLLGILTPLESEFKGRGPLLRNRQTYWSESVDIGTFSSTEQLSTRKLILCSFREFVLLPYFDAEIDVPEYLPLEDLKILTQCFGMIKSVQSTNYSQRIVDHIFGLLFKCNPVE
ncbi:hypothetical protein WICPIJ_000651 [Wickerhamomyces pijperi]|uniref:Target of rapamycin complex 2 subunit BIT2 n=1 Tax=Wickerhamomyces pijperi TaxID=599730 RepID=A0A9P8QG27_WICPI|nr:hypothetical protein WICPIJ_000651 [Wickerhamomyces pijperi]